MSNEVIILLLEATIMYLLVLAAHSLRHRFGPVHFYALIGGVTAIMSWVTDAGLTVTLGSITFVVGSTVFYTSLLLGVFVVYVFDGPRATRITISTIVGVSIMMPLIAAALHFQANLIGAGPIASVPLPSLRINTASVLATLLDLIFLAIAWEFLGKPRLRIDLWIRTWLTLLGVMWLDVILFATGAFAGTPTYLSIMQGTLVSRFVISLVALPFLYGYIYWQSNVKGAPLENRPVLAILSQVAEMKAELTLAQQEIERRKKAEQALHEANERLVQQERQAAIGSLTAGLAHVFNNILAGLTLRVQMAQKSRNAAERDRHLRLAKDQLKEAATLIEKLLDFSRKGLVRRGRVDLTALLQEQGMILRRQLPPDIDLRLDLPQAPCEVDADGTRLEEVVHNLVRNAQDALPGGGGVRLALYEADAGDEAGNNSWCTVCQRPVAGRWVHLQVVDDGEGIAGNDRTRIFEPFFTTRGPQRRGLGLSQVLGIVKQHGGHINVHSDANAGATVTVYLPPYAANRDGTS